MPAQAINPINPGVKWWKEPFLIALFDWLTVVVLYATFVGFHNTTRATSGPLSPFTVARLVCQKHRAPDEQVMHIALAPPQASPPLQLRSK